MKNPPKLVVIHYVLNTLLEIMILASIGTFFWKEIHNYWRIPCIIVAILSVTAVWNIWIGFGHKKSVSLPSLVLVTLALSVLSAVFMWQTQDYFILLLVVLLSLADIVVIFLLVRRQNKDFLAGSRKIGNDY